MKIIRRIFIITFLIVFALFLIMLLYINSGYQLYFNIGSIKIGNSNNNIIYIFVGIFFFIIATYYLIRYLLTRRGIIISIIFYFLIFMLPFSFLIFKGMNSNHSFTYKTESHKKLLIMGYGNKKGDDMKYVIYENLFLGFYDKIGEIDKLDYMLSSDNVILKTEDIMDNSLYYEEQDKKIILTYVDANNEIIVKELSYKHK